ncbi:MAG: hypothetical protein D6739_07360 [Nitrospirae bacterium]|nr:MAG: hypothetical protein D6739_07360 [Nitrospirota bacterium]
MNLRQGMAGSVGRRSRLRVLVLSGMAGWAAVAGATSVIQDLQGKIQRHELPAWCAYTQETPASYARAEKERYARRYGPAWAAMHHACRGLDDLNRAASATGDLAQRNLLKAAAREFDYVLEHAGPRYPFRPFLLVKKGTALLRLGRRIDALEAFQAALRADRGYEDAYLAMAHMYAGRGDRETALLILEQGLHFNPTSERLQAAKANLSAADGGH